MAGKESKTSGSKKTKKGDAKKAMLYDGEQMEYSVTVQVPGTGGQADMWVKGGAVTHKQPGESDKRLFQRTTRFVEDVVNIKVEEITGG